ncbi:phosphatase PAP2 family protein [Clostridiaceae bacterium]|nr:phosphatase PAP2 family protein [Clostridiaceae bacterium]
MRIETYRKISAWFYGHVWAYKLLVRLNNFLPALFYVLYPVLLGILAARGDARLWRVLCVPAAAFGVCTVVRRLVHAPRPYERVWFEPLMVHDGTGNSFPSRHVTSAAVIAAAYGYVWPLAGVVLGAAAGCIAVGRVLAGIHYLRDVLAGGALGAGFGLVGFWLL